MSYEDWKAATDPKVHGSWNLHSLLPQDLDFFILLSSLSGIVGHPGQANYAAGNTYQDALARYRAERGQAAAAIDLGGMFSEGYISENQAVAEQFFAMEYFTPLYQQDLFSLLRNLCSLPPPSPQTNQVLFGLVRPPNLSPDDFTTYSQAALAPPLFKPMRNIHGSVTRASTSPSGPDYRALFLQASTDIEAGEVVTQAMIRKLQATLHNMDKVDVWKPMLTYGVDSLVSVELRNWFAKEFRAQITVFEIMGGATFTSIGRTIASSSELRKDRVS